jgi:DNA-directed RNA polymerase specialized sigma24 family protein
MTRCCPYQLPVVSQRLRGGAVSDEVETAESAATVGPQPDRVDVRTFAKRYALHAAHVFDYCRALTGSDAVAASATSAALAYARQQPPASHLLRARLIATARQEALAFAATGPGWPDAAAPGQAADSAVGGVLRHLPAGHREVLALVYRHGVWPEQLPAVLAVSARDAYERLAAAEHDFVAVATAQRPAGSSCPSLEDIGAAPLPAVPGLVWRDAVAELTAGTSAAAALPSALHAAGSLARPRRRLRLTVAAALPVVAVGCWAIVAGAGSARPVAVRDTGEPSAIGTAPQSARPTPTPEAAGTAPAKQGAAPTRPGPAPTVPILALLPSTPAGSVLPVATTTGAPQTSPSASASPSSSPSASSSAAPSPSASSSAAPSPSASSSAAPSPSAPASSAAPSPTPSDSASSTSPSVPDPSPTS